MYVYNTRLSLINIFYFGNITEKIYSQNTNICRNSFAFIRLTFFYFPKTFDGKLIYFFYAAVEEI